MNRCILNIKERSKYTNEKWRSYINLIWFFHFSLGESRVIWYNEKKSNKCTYWHKNTDLQKVRFFGLTFRGWYISHHIQEEIKQQLTECIELKV